MPRQMTLDLPLHAAQGRADFLVAPSNAQALAALDAAAGWPLGKMVLIGPEGSGKSHLAQVFAADYDARVIDAALLAMTDLPDLARGAVVVEDADRIAGYAAGETALFHLHNLMQAGGHLLLITACTPPARWGLRLADLASRMEATATARLDPPDDMLLAGVLVKLFADRQLAVPAALIPWLVARMDRSLAFARRLVEALDARALAERRPLGRALAQQVLDSLTPPGP